MVFLNIKALYDVNFVHLDSVDQLLVVLEDQVCYHCENRSDFCLDYVLSSVYYYCFVGAPGTDYQEKHEIVVFLNSHQLPEGVAQSE